LSTKSQVKKGNCQPRVKLREVKRGKNKIKRSKTQVIAVKNIKIN
jgi:hypothetical protein